MSRMLSSEYNNNNNENSEQESRVPVRRARVPPHYKLDEPKQEQSTLSVESNNSIIILKIEQESNESRRAVATVKEGSSYLQHSIMSSLLSI